METNVCNLSRDEVIAAVNKTHGDSHLLDLIKLMPDNWDLRLIIDVIPDRHMSIMVRSLGLTENDRYFALEESQVNLTTSAGKERERAEKAAVKEMALDVAEPVPVDEFSEKKYETEIKRIDGEYASGVVKLVKNWIDGEDLGEWDEDADDWMDEEDDEDDEDLFDDEDEWDDFDEAAADADRAAEEGYEAESDAHKDDDNG